MPSYKIELTQTQKYIIDVKAKNEDKAKKKASKLWNEVCEKGIYHYHEDGDAEVEITNVFDVTGTDDPFNP